jgi:chemotaxis protein methyltransferase WspC
MFRQRYFEPSMGGYRICERVRHMVSFIHGNVLDTRFLADHEPYDVIFCRNMLIYFDEPAKSRGLQLLDRLLTPEGLLFVGYAETGLFLTSAYMPVRYPRAFAYRKAGARDDGQHPSRRSSAARARPPHDPGQLPVAPHMRQWTPSPAVPGAEAGEPPRPRDDQAPALETARRLADQGELEAAATLCETSMRAHGPSAQAYVLLGLIRQAAGNAEQAEHCLGRALYLQPDHYEALVHLALLMEHRGDAAMAAVLRQRAQRARHDAR